VKRALITGVGGQDGSYLAEFLLETGYEVVGLVRLGAEPYENLTSLAGKVELYEADLARIDDVLPPGVFAGGRYAEDDPAHPGAHAR